MIDIAFDPCAIAVRLPIHAGIVGGILGGILGRIFGRIFGRILRGNQGMIAQIRQTPAGRM
jgi:hypothetical protein